MEIIEFIQANPVASIVIISILVTAITTSIRYFVTDRKLMREIKEKQKIIREEMKLHKDNPDKIAELNKQMMENLPAQMKQSFKLMLITFVPLILLLSWLRNTFSMTTIATTWIWWYIVISIATSIILGKIIKLD